jgi:DsbC/DsbD-like thiol-disulfide interchange protein
LSRIHAVLALILSAPAAWAEAPRAEARLVAGWPEADGVRVAGLSITLAPGWKTYWRAPGEAGIPPAFDWSGSRNLAEVSVEWPAPVVFDSFGMMTLGYADAVTLPLVLRAEAPDQPIEVRLTLDYGVCADICVPESVELSLTIAPDAAPAGAVDIAAARAAAPTPGAAVGAVAACSVRGAGAARRFEGMVRTAGSPLRDAPVLVVEGPSGAWFSETETRLDAGGVVRAEGEVHLDDANAWIARDALRLTLIGPDGALEFRGCAGADG